MKIRSLAVCLIMSLVFHVKAQVSVIDTLVNVEFADNDTRVTSAVMQMLDFTYAYKQPGGALLYKFGAHSEFGASFFFKTKYNTLFGVDLSMIVGNEVRDLTSTSQFRDENGYVLGKNGVYSDILFLERGMNASLKIGQVFNVFKSQPNSGIMILGGLGFTQNRIVFKDKFNEVPLLSGLDYYKGYDRLSNGWMISEFIGYRWISTGSKIFNIFAGIEATQAYTKNRRRYNYNMNSKNNLQKLELTRGVKIGFALTFYKRHTKVEY